MNARAYTYILLVVIAAIAIITTQSWSSVQDVTEREFFALGVLLALIALSDWTPVRLSIGSKRTVRSSMAFLPLFTAALLFPPALTVVIAALSAIVTQLTLNGRALWKVVGNSSLVVVSVGSALLAYTALGGEVGDKHDVRLIAFFAFALVFFLTNTVVVSGLYAVRNGSPFFRVFLQVIGPGGINLVYGLLASPIAIFAVYLYQRLYVGGLVLITLPLLLIRYSYVSKIQLQQSNRDLLKVLIKTIETRDPYTSGHSLRVSLLARIIAEDIGLSPKQVEIVETAALLHDIGKIDSVYAEIIQKKEALTDEEHRVIKTHAVKGAELLRNLTSFSEDVIRGVRHHHERYDGKGYPDGLRGNDIPIASRIIMICDSIDAMLSDRPYRSALTIEDAQHEIRRCAGSQFDPHIVDVVLRRNTLQKAADRISQDSKGALEPV